MALRSATASSDGDTTSRKRRARSPSKPKAAFFIIQVLDEQGNPMAFDKKRIKLLSVERDAEKVLDMTESGTYPNALYLRGMVPVDRPSRTPAEPVPPPAA